VHDSTFKQEYVKSVRWAIQTKCLRLEVSTAVDIYTVIFQAMKPCSLQVDMELSEELTTSASCMNEIGYLE
jgi:hypothetical protein